MNMKMIRQLFPLAIGGIALGSTEFIPMGLMRTMGGDLHLSDDQVGNFIAAYAIGVVVGAPTLVGLSTRFQPKKVLIAFMLLFSNWLRGRKKRWLSRSCLVDLPLPICW